MTKSGATKRVLIVDDEPNVLDVLKQFIASFKHGHAYEITTAASAVEALAILRREGFDLILLDLLMPAADGRWLSEKSLGLNLLTRFKDLGVTAPVLMMTGGGAGSVKEVDALHAGAAGYLYKPIGLRELDQAVTLVLGASPR